MTIKRVNGRDSLPEQLRGGVVAIGNFDGVHRGHQSVLEQALDIAHKNEIPALVLTFEPHPRAVFQPDTPLYRLSPAPMKAKLLEFLGFDAVIEEHFTKEFAKHSADEFIQNILIKRFGVKHVVTGFDFHFGKGREGGPAYLMQAGQDHNFGVKLVDAFRDENTEVISSSRIRALLNDGNVAEAAGLLGYHYTVGGEVVKGQQLGRTLGYPTANIILDDSDGLKNGIYAVRFRLQNGDLHNGVASFGRRPTVVDDGAPILETFIFDFDADIYGQICEVSLFSYLRGEEKFDGLEPLIAQMKRDEAEAREVLAHLKPLGMIDQKIAFFDKQETIAQ